jgi:hypothetical protein
MIPEAGTTCRFTFTARFVSLSGVYRVRACTTFQDALVSGIDFVESLYTPAGLAQADFDTDYNSYFNDRVVVLESVQDDTVVYYVPESVFQTVPDPTIKEYFPLILVANLGVHENTQAIYPLLDQMKDLVASALGTDDPFRIMTNPQNKVYLTDTEYAALKAERATLAKELIPLSVQLKAANDKIAYLAAQVASYEQLITTQATAPNP